MTAQRKDRKSNARRPIKLLLGGAVFAVAALVAVTNLEGALRMPMGFGNLTPVSDDELAGMRGGFVLPNGMILTFQLTFRTLVNHIERSFQTFDEDSIPEDATGVINSVTVEPGDGLGEPVVDIAVEPTTEITGIMNVIRNNVSGITIQNQNSLTIDLSNVNQAIAATQANNLAFRLRSLSLFGL